MVLRISPSSADTPHSMVVNSTNVPNQEHCHLKQQISDSFQPDLKNKSERVNHVRGVKEQLSAAD